MRILIPLLLTSILAGACSSKKKANTDTQSATFTIAFGSCNDHLRPNLLWDDIRVTQPDVWIWGGDNIYADTEDVSKIAAMYKEQMAIPEYAALTASVPIIGTWDDHDYGINDGGVEFSSKAGSQQALLDFLGVAENSPQRRQEGVYSYHDYKAGSKTIRIILLDTRYFRTPLTPGTGEDRYKPNPFGKGELLGEEQWAWLERSLGQSKADFHIVMSSIQFLSSEHGWEKWANFPHEVVRFKELVTRLRPKGLILLSGDRHISEFSGDIVPGLSYELIDFTSSGLTHAYRDYSGEPNAKRIGEVVFTESFGLVRIDTTTGEVLFQMIGDNGEVLQEITRSY